jgi:hypothetical protein
MDTEEIIEAEIAPRLHQSFDPYTVNALLTRATLCYVTTRGDGRKKHRAFVHSICVDKRAVDVWGAEVAARQEQEWQALFDLTDSPDREAMEGERT